MEGYQFAHVDVYSVKGSPGRGPEAYAVRENGERVWTVQEILDEAERLEHASFHVVRRGVEPEIMPGAVSTFEALREAHAAAASVRVPFKRKKKDGSITKGKRKLRRDQASIYTCIVSLPVLSEDALADPDLRARCLSTLKAAMEHERERIEADGGTLMLGVIHWDESHVHAHIYALDPARGAVSHLHPGRAAKEEFLQRHQQSGQTRKKLNQGGNRAYCDAMREWQDDFYAGVFRDAGLLRIGPRHLRLPKAKYNKLKRAAAARAADEETHKLLVQSRWELRRSLRTLQANSAAEGELMREWTEALATEREAVREWATEVEAREKTVEAREDGVGDREAKVAQREASAIDSDAALKKRETSVEKREKDAEESHERGAAREAEVDASLALIEAAAEGLVEFGEGKFASSARPTEAARTHPSWRKLSRRIRPAQESIGGLFRTLGAHFRKLRDAAREAGLTEARREAQAEVAETKTLMETAVDKAGQVGAVARMFASKLRPADRDQMLAEIDQTMRETARRQVIAESSHRKATGTRQSQGDEETQE